MLDREKYRFRTLDSAHPNREVPEARRPGKMIANKIIHTTLSKNPLIIFTLSSTIQQKILLINL